VDTVPAVFALDEEDVAVVLDPDAAPLDDIFDAAQNCPVDAIVILDSDGQQVYP
jgi:ferredoxin